MMHSYQSSMPVHHGGVQGHPLEVTVVGCNKLKDKEWISRQDPYVCLEYGSTKYKTRTHTDGGKNPTFQEKFVFNLIQGLQEITVHVWNSNTVSFDDFIGTGKVQLHKVLSQGFDDNAWSIHSKTGRHSGEVRVIMHYANANANKPATSYAPSAATTYAPPATSSYTQAPAPYAPPYGAPPTSAYPNAHQYPTAYPHNPSTHPPNPSAYPPSAHPPNPSAYPPSAYPPNPSAYPPSSYPPPPPSSPYPPQPYPPTAYPPQTSSYYPPPGPYSGSYPPQY